jgi:hypothetical protein
MEKTFKLVAIDTELPKEKQERFNDWYDYYLTKIERLKS